MRRTSRRCRQENFVDAQLVALRQAARSVVPAAQRGAGEATSRPRSRWPATSTRCRDLEEKKPTRRTIDPLKKTHAEMFKHLQDEQPRACSRRTKARSPARAPAPRPRPRAIPTSCRSSIRSARRGRVPTTIKDAELANLSADVCLTIADRARSPSYEFVRKSGNIAVRQLARGDARRPSRSCRRRPIAGAARPRAGACARPSRKQ